MEQLIFYIQYKAFIACRLKQLMIIMQMIYVYF